MPQERFAATCWVMGIWLEPQKQNLQPCHNRPPPACRIGFAHIIVVQWTTSPLDFIEFLVHWTEIRKTSSGLLVHWTFTSFE